MKKIILLSSLFIIAAIINAQDKTVSVKFNKQTSTYVSHTFSAADTLTSNQDTIDVVVLYRSSGYVKKIAVKTRFDVIAGADTTVSTSVFGKEFEDDATYVQIIAASVSSEVAADNTIQVLTADYTETTTAFNAVKDAYNLTSAAYAIDADTSNAGNIDTLYVPSYTIAVPADTLEFPAQTVTPLDKSYRYYRIRYILSGNDSVGTGIKLDELEVKLYTD